jgi:hypothetical protein
MYNNGPLGAIGSDGSNVLERVRRTGYRPCFAAQLRAVDGSSRTAGVASRSLKEVFNDWVNNDIGAELLRDKRATEFGVSEYNGVWGLVLARPHRATGGC